MTPEEETLQGYQNARDEEEPQTLEHDPTRVSPLATPEERAEQQRQRAEILAGTRGLPPGKSGTPYLIVVEGGIPGMPFRIDARLTTIGRGPDNSIQFLVGTISRHHVRLAIGENRQAWLTDVGSANGTLLNDQRLPVRVTVPFKHGDHIVLGSAIHLRFVWLDPRDEETHLRRYEGMIRDGLTGLFNRLYLHDQIELFAQRGYSKDLGLAVGLIDVDAFTAINDHHGHAVGDEVLRGVARVITESAPKDALIARFGGDEFLIAFHQPDFKLAEAALRQLLAALGELAVPTRAGELSIKASAGMAYSPTHRQLNPMGLISLADRNLRDAKDQGRNRLVATEVNLSG
jgi:diguanylate cyclase (GGDEF)-like protein